MGEMASGIASLTLVYSSVYPGADQRKYQSTASLAFVWGIHRWPVNSPHKWPITRKMFPFNDVIMSQYGQCCLNPLASTQCYEEPSFCSGTCRISSFTIKSRSVVFNHKYWLLGKYMSFQPRAVAFKISNAHSSGSAKAVFSLLSSTRLVCFISSTISRAAWVPVMSGKKWIQHYDVIKWKFFSRNCPFVWGIHRWPVDSPHKRTVTGTFDVSLLSV